MCPTGANPSLPLHAIRCIPANNYRGSSHANQIKLLLFQGVSLRVRLYIHTPAGIKRGFCN